MTRSRIENLIPLGTSLTREQHIFDQTLSVPGEYAAIPIINAILQHKEARRVGFYGPAASGKSTLMVALETTLLQMNETFHVKFHINTIYFDPHRAELLKEYDVNSAMELDEKVDKLGVRSGPRQEYRERLTARLTALPEKPKNAQSNERWITLVEKPAVGKQDRELGHTAAIVDGAQKNTVGVILLANNALYDMSGKLRAEAHKAKNDYEFKMNLKEKGFYNGPIDEEKDKKSKELKHKYSIMGSADQIKANLAELDSEAENLYVELIRNQALQAVREKQHREAQKLKGQSVDNVTPLDLVEIVENEMNIEGRFNMSPGELAIAKMRVWHAHMLLAKWKFRRGLGFVAINQKMDVSGQLERL